MNILALALGAGLIVIVLWDAFEDRGAATIGVASAADRGVLPRDLESHISYPATAYFRSHHQGQSWVSALSAVLDVSALVAVGIERVPRWQARVTPAIARHMAVDLTQVLHARTDMSADRLTRDGGGHT